jgi:hypothetical protein
MRRIESLSEDEKLVLGAVIEDPGADPGTLAFRTGIGIGDVLALLGALELKDLVYSSGQRFYPEK